MNNYDDVVEIPEWLFREKQVRGFVNPFHLKTPLNIQYNVILIHHNATDLNSELKVAGKFFQYIAQVHMKNIVEQMAIKNGELMRETKIKIKVYAIVR